MSRRHLVATLPENEQEFLIDSYIKGGCKTSRALSAAYEKEFKKKLSKSSVHRWLSAIGEDLIEKYELQRQIGNQIATRLSQEPNADKFKVVIDNIQDMLLMGLHDVIEADPIALIKIQQEEKKREQKDREIELKERAQQFTEDQAKKAEQIEKDRFEIAADTWNFVLQFVKMKSPSAVDELLAISPELLTELEKYIAQKA